ncbi:MAG: methionyl-tRNA formyltransferase [Cytophagaceae bacterium]
MGLRIVYMGTPDFAVPTLERLIEDNQNVVAVVTAPDKPSGRGLKLQSSPVKDAAVKHNIPVLQPDKLKDETFVNELKALDADLFIVVAFRMLPEIVWNMPKIGTFNLHASLLPKYRGAAPINWAIINGETETGCTTFFLKHEIDTGDIILQEKELILPEDTFETLYNKLKIKGASLVSKTVSIIEGKEYTLLPQIGESIHAPKIYKETGKLDFNESCVLLHNKVRGLYPFPGTYFEYHDKNFKVHLSQYEITKHNQPTGTLVTDSKTYIKFACPDGYFEVLEIQAEGKKRLKVKEFFLGNKI